MAKRKPKRDIYQEVTDKILCYLEQGTAPWRQPIIGRGDSGIPVSLTTGKQYRGINVFLLALTAWFEGYSSPHWVTFKQAKDRGGSIKKGEKGSLVIFWKWYDREDMATGEVDRLPILRHYTVFNAEQCEGVEAPDLAAEGELNEFNPIEQCEQVITGYKDCPPIEHGGKVACYVPSKDRIKIAKPDLFVTSEDYYATLFHECAHSTGHEKRLNRERDQDFGGHVFGSPEYGLEELVAETSAAFLCAHAGISPPTIENTAAYIDGWRRKLKGDKKLVIQAAAKGQAATDYILGVTFDNASKGELILNSNNAQKPTIELDT